MKTESPPGFPDLWLSRRQALGFVGGVVATAALGCRSEGGGPTGAPDTETANDQGVRPAPGLPAPSFVDTNGVRLAVYEQGSGLPVVFCHGFPELAYSWRHQLPAFSAAGYRAIAPDQRGYGLSDRPPAIEQYTLEQLCADMADLLDAKGIGRAVFCGHDWGGGVVWMMPRLYPERVAGVIGINTPAFDPRYPRAPEDDPLIVRTESYYTNTFQEPGVAEAVLERDVRRTFEFFMRRGGLWNVDELRRLPEDSPERRMDILAMLEKGEPTGELLLTDDELDYFVHTFQATGFTGGLNWYRAAALESPDAEARAAELAWDIEVPCLYVGAENDVILRPSLAEGMERFISDSERHTIADCGHWTQQERPEALNRVTLDWLQRKFPTA